MDIRGPSELNAGRNECSECRLTASEFSVRCSEGLGGTEKMAEQKSAHTKDEKAQPIRCSDDGDGKCEHGEPPTPLEEPRKVGNRGERQNGENSSCDEERKE